MAITSKDLLEHLTDLQLALEDYSFEKMTAAEARVVKSSYEVFRKQLETRLWDSKCQTEISGPERNTEDIPFQSEVEAVGNALRNPLQGISGFAQILSEAPLEEPYKSIASSLYMASGVMKETLEELGGYSRIKNDRDPKVILPFSPAQILEEVMDYARLQLLDKPVKIHLNLTGRMGETMNGNPSDFRRILMNIVGNACRYTLSGTIHITATVKESEGVPEVYIEVSDTGIGIPEVELPHVFKPYYQGKQALELAEKGTGFGLSIAHQLLSRQGGKIKISSSEGIGTKVRLYLPLSLNTSQVPVAKAPLKTSLGKGALTGRRVLFLENDAHNRELLLQQLEFMGCETYPVSHISEGMQLLESQPMDAFLMDFRIQSKRDLKALEMIRNHQNSYIRNFPVIGLTADTKTLSEADQKSAGLDGLLQKPYSREALLAAIKKYATKNGLIQVVRSASMDAETEISSDLVDLSYLESKCQGDVKSLNILVKALRNGMLEFAGRTRIGLKQHDYKSISEGAEKLLIALEMIKAHSLIEPVLQIRMAAIKGVDENKIVRAFSIYLDRYPEVSDILERHMGLK